MTRFTGLFLCAILQFGVGGAVLGGAQGTLPAGRGDRAYEERFMAMWKTLHDPACGYFSRNGLPYHSVETFIIEAPDYGHLTTSEAMSYWLFLEARYGHVTGDWSKLAVAWEVIEQHAIPTKEDQPTAKFYNPAHPASYAAEYETPDRYPSQLRFDVPVGQDPIGRELQRAYGSQEVYGMHWLIDVDNWYGYGRRSDGRTAPAFINTFQRGPMESVWATVPHPSWEAFKFGGRNGFLDLFTRDNNYSPQWRYTTAPDADARAVEAMYFAYEWAAQKNQQEKIPVAKGARMGDYLRYSMFDKYFKKIGSRSEREPGAGGYESAHHLLGWYYAWGGPTDPNANWGWRIGCSHIHSGYQNPLAAWVLANHREIHPKSPNAARDWKLSLDRQIEFYRWLQSAEGAIAGGVTASWNGRYEPPPAGTRTFKGLAYDWQPVYHDPPSNNWFGMQTWTMGRLAEFYYVTGDKNALEVLDKWVTWASAQVKLSSDGSFALPQNLQWSGQPDEWNDQAPGANANLHAAVSEWNQDVGVAGSLARTFLYYSAGKKRWDRPDPRPARIARQLLDHLWAKCRDDKGVSAPEERGDYRRVFEQRVAVPAGFSGKMANGDAITPGARFIDLRSKYKQDPAFAEVERAVKSGKAPVFRYHRFWAQVEVALAMGAMAELETGDQ